MQHKLTYFIMLVTFLTFTSCTMYKNMKAMKKPRYESGEHKGSQFCSSCHKEIYDQWFSKSRHAIATTAKSFHEFKTKFTDKFMFNIMMGESMCYNCHGSKKVNEGVNCETCHGPVIPNVSIENTHKKKFKPGLENLKKPDFCAQCHEMKNPRSGDFVMSLYSEWQKSEAAANDITCQKCHMAVREGKFLYHGFDTAVRNDGIYRGDLSISDIKVDFPQLSLVIENHVTGHSIPAGGPGRILVIELSFKNLKGDELYKTTRTFAKKFKLMANIMPYKLIENTQLRSGEKRPLTFTIPSELKGKISNVVLVLRMYEVSDDNRGDIKKAHWVSEPILTQEVKL